MIESLSFQGFWTNTHTYTQTDGSFLNHGEKDKVV